MTRWRHRRIGTIGCVAVVVLAAGGLLSATAQAELCDAATRICIVGPPTTASPWLPPQLVQLRLPSEADPTYSGASWTQPGVPGAEFPRSLESGRYPIKGKLQLLEQGPPGGTSLYQGTIEPWFAAEHEGSNRFLPMDGTLTLSVQTSLSDPLCQCAKSSTATFAGLPIFSAISGFNWRIVRSGRWFRAVMSFEARSPVRVEQTFHVSAFTKGNVDRFPLPLMTRQVTGTGPMRVVQKLSAAYVQRKCSGYRRCQLYAEGQMGSAAESRLEDGLLSSISRPVTIQH